MAYTINANAKNVWIRDNEDTRDLSIQTDASSVYLDNGRTLEQELGEGSMVSNVVTVDSAMSKVIDGTLDGAYESLVFKGKSLVNLLTSFRPDTDSNWVRNGSSFTLNASGVLFLNYAALLKPNTTYTVVGELDFDVDGIVIGFREGNKSWEVNRSIGSRGRFAVLISTSAESTSNALTVHRAVTSNSDRITLSNLMVLEGDWTNAELPPYFEGLGSCKMPILHNIGKNLLSPSYIQRVYFGVTVGSPIVIHQSISGEHSSIVKYPCKVGDTYTLTYTSGNADRNIVTELDANDVVLKTSTIRTNTYTVANSNTKKLCWYIGQDASNPIPSNAIMLEVGEQQTGFEDHKTNILRTPETLTLRSLPNGVRDELNLKTGEYIQRVGEIVLDGSLNAEGIYNEVGETTTGFFFPLDTIQIKGGDSETVPNQIISDKFRTENHECQWMYGMLLDEEFLSATSDGRIAVRLLTTKASTLDEFHQYLQSNPITVQYELAEPITTIVEPSTIPFTYQNGHVILESGFEGQSLLPTLEYSTVVNRIGQVESVAKVIQKQEKQLTMLEQMLIQNIIELDYNNTVLALNLEINEVM